MTKILLVEDDKSLQEIYGVRLRAEGYDIIAAGDGEEALALAIKERPGLIVSDVMMPKISGFDMLDILRSTTETRDIKVIMMTALSSEDQRARGEALGADRYLVKSQVGIEDVVRTVHEVLGDAPTTAAPSFSQPQAAAGMRPAPTTAPAPRPAQPVDPAPVAAPAPIFAPQAPAPQPAPVAPAPVAPAPAPVGLPQPTAPFSTDRPASLADRVIQPLAQPNTQQEATLGSRMDQELGSVDTTPVFQPLPPTPPSPPAANPFGPISPAPPTTPGIQFEETPLQTPPATPGAQPPAN